jgi:hypothetical protein
LPADHLKGLMRAAADTLFAAGTSRAGAVFGTPAAPSPWAWSSAWPEGGGWEFGRRHRVAIDGLTHAARKDHLVLGEQAWAECARFEVSRVRWLDEQSAHEHALILRAAGAAVHGLGAWRRRGLGWVGIAPDEPVSPDDVAMLLALLDASRAAGGRR